MPYTWHRPAWTHLQQCGRPRLVSARHVLGHHFNVLVRYLLDLERDPHSLRKGTIRVPVHDEICGLRVEFCSPARGAGCRAWSGGAAGGGSRGRVVSTGCRGRVVVLLVGFLCFFCGFEEGALDAIFLDAVAFDEAVFVRRGRAVGGVARLLARGAVDALNGVVTRPAGAWVIGWEVSAWGKDAERLRGGGVVGVVAAGSAGVGVHQVVHGAACVSAGGVNSGVEFGLGHESGCAREIFCDFNLDIAQVPLSGCTPALLLIRITAFGSPRWSALEPAIPVVADERFALVLLGAAVRVDIVDVREVRLKLFFGKCDGLIDVEETFAPLNEVWRVLHQLHPSEMPAALFVPSIWIMV